MKRTSQLCFLSLAFLLLAGISGCPGNGEGYGAKPTSNSMPHLPDAFEPAAGQSAWPVGATYVERAANESCVALGIADQKRTIKFGEYPEVVVQDPCAETFTNVEAAATTFSSNYELLLYENSLFDLVEITAIESAPLN